MLFKIIHSRKPLNKFKMNFITNVNNLFLY